MRRWEERVLRHKQIDGGSTGAGGSCRRKIIKSLPPRPLAPLIMLLVALRATAAQAAPLCGQLDDKQVHIPANWATFTPPAAGQSYVDPAFGCTVKRLTNGSLEALWDGNHPGLMNQYSTLAALNATDTLLFV